MKAYLINMHLLVPRSRSSAKVKVKYKGYISQKMAVLGAFVFHKHILFAIIIHLNIFQNYLKGMASTGLDRTLCKVLARKNTELK